MKKLNRNYVPPNYTDLRTRIFEEHPFHCAGCGKEISFKNPQYEYTAVGKNRVILHGYVNEPLCNHCYAKRIELWFNTPLDQLTKRFLLPSESRKIGQCDICSGEKLVASIIWDDFANSRFGSNWWNGHWICCDCLVECAEHGFKTSGHVGYDDKGRYDINEAGAKVYVKT